METGDLSVKTGFKMEPNYFRKNILKKKKEVWEEKKFGGENKLKIKSKKNAGKRNAYAKVRKNAS